MRLLPDRLGPKLNLALLIFFVVMGATTAAIVYFSFDRSQREATEQSQAGLEEQSKRELRNVALNSAGQGQRIVGQATEASVSAARFMEAFPLRGGDVPWDASTLTRTAAGHWYDGNASRTTDVWLHSTVPMDEANLSDLSDTAPLDTLFPTLYEQNDDAVAVYFTSPRGLLRYYPVIDIHEQDADFILESIPPLIDPVDPINDPEREPRWTAPYEDPAGQGYIVTVLTPVYVNDEFRGSIGVDLSATTLIARADEIQVTPGGFAFVMDREGTLIPGASRERVQPLFDAPTEEFARTLAAMRAGNTGVDRVEIEGEEVFVAYSSLGDFGGSLAVVAPIEELTVQAQAVNQALEEQAGRTLAITLATMAGFFVIALLVSAWLTRRALLRPIAALVTGTRAVAGGDLAARIPIESEDELGTLALSFNGMTEQLASSRQALETQNVVLVEQEARYRSIFASANDGMIITDPSGRIVEANPAVCRMHGYTREEFLRLDPRDFIDPDDHYLFGEYMTTVMAGGDYRCRARDIRKDGSQFYVEVLGTPIVYEGERHILGVVRDVTEQVQAEQMLEQRVDERTGELQALVDVSRGVNSTLDLQSLMDLALEQVKRVVEYDIGAFMVLEGNVLTVMAVVGEVAGLQESQLGLTFPGDPPGAANAMVNDQPLIIDDVRADNRRAAAYRATVGPLLDTSLASIRSWMGVPLTNKGRRLGLLALARETPGFYTERHAQLARAIGQQVAAAMENARLFEQTEERSHELQTLLDVASDVSSTIEVQPLLRLMLEQVRELAGYDRASVMVLHGDEFIVEATAGDHIMNEVGTRVPMSTMNFMRDEMLAGQAVRMDDIHDDSPLARAYRADVGEDRVARTPSAAWMAVPLALKDRLVGCILLAHGTRGTYTERHEALVGGIALQAAIALDNAQLFAREEQQKRELQALLDVSRDVSSTLELDTVIRLVLQQMGDVAKYDRATLVMRDGGAIRVRAVYPPEPGLGAELGDEFPMDENPLMQQLFGGNEAVLIDDVQSDDPLAVAYRQRAGTDYEGRYKDVRSWLAVPLAQKDRVIGAITLSRTEPNAFTAREIQLARAIASQAAFALDNAQLFQQTQERTRELQTLLDVSRDVTSELELQPLIELTLAQIRTIAPYDRASLMLREDDDLIVQAIFPVDEEKGARPGERFPFQGRPLGEIMRTGNAAILDDAHADTPAGRAYRRTIADDAEGRYASVRSWMAVPLVLKDDAIGLIAVSSDAPHAFNEHQADLARAIANAAASAIENARLFERAEERTRELQTLLDVSRDVTSTLELQPLMETVLEQVHRVVPFRRAGLLLREGDTMRVMAMRDVLDPQGDSVMLQLGGPWPITNSDIVWNQILRNEPVFIPDVRADTPIASGYRDIVGDLTGAFERVRSWTGVPLATKDGVIGMITLVSDEANFFTERHAQLVQAMAGQAAFAIDNARLFERVEQRTRELQALLDVSRDVTSTLELQPLMDAVLRQVRQVVRYRRAALLLRDGDVVEVMAVEDVQEPEGEAVTGQVGMRLPVTAAPAIWGPIIAGETVIVSDTTADNDLARDYRSLVGRSVSTEASRSFASVRSWMGTPLRSKEGVIGILTFVQDEVDAFSERDAELVRAIAGQAAFAIENARLYERAEQRTRELQTLLDVSRDLGATLELEPLMALMLEQLRDVADYSRASLFMREDAGLVVRASVPEELAVARGTTFPFARIAPLWDVLSLGKVIAIDDVQSDEPFAVAYREAAGNVPPDLVNPVRSWLGVPLLVQDRVVGIVALSHGRAGFYTQSRSALVQAIANQAAFAIENARLYAEAQGKAALEERQRLARELHDSVSQALYGIALGARTARTLLDRDPSKVGDPLDYVLQLAEAGLAEMRALIFELRPESLETEGLVAALQKQVAATQARYGIVVDADFAAEPDATLASKEAAYRIAQEAMHNVVKHARATNIWLRVGASDGVIEVDVRDDGAGFDPQGDFAGHLGLRSMRERATSLGGTLDVESAPGEGSRITARIPR